MQGAFDQPAVRAGNVRPLGIGRHGAELICLMVKTAGNATDTALAVARHGAVLGGILTEVVPKPTVPEPVKPTAIVTRPWPVHQPVRGSALTRLLRTTDAKQIGLMYMTTAFVFFAIGGVMALLMRAELARPGLQFLSPEQYNQLFTMHGTIMLLFFATPIVFAFANYIVPLQIGAPDVSFARLNAFAYWLYLFGASTAVAGFATPGGAADFGWFAYTPLNSQMHTPGVGADLWIVGPSSAVGRSSDTKGWSAPRSPSRPCR
jgi:hypothetical protein